MDVPDIRYIAFVQQNAIKSLLSDANFKGKGIGL